jgi:hypothetical protein
MNEQLQQALASLIAMVVTGAEALYEFGAEQVPLVLQQLLLWHAVQSLIYFCIGMLMTLVCGYLAVAPYLYAASGRTRHKLGRWWGSDAELPVSVIMVPCLAAGLVITMNSLAWLKIWLAPNLYLLEYAAKLIK